MLHPQPWLELPAAARELYSLGMGISTGLLLVAVTRWAVLRWSWMKRLHSDLRPVARGLTPFAAIVVAFFSSVAEELLFRGLLQLWLGLGIQALIFALLHYLPGPSRWTWALSAGVVGLVFGLMFKLTGSLTGPVVAHFLVNAINLIYLKSHDPDPRRPALGGLLGQRS